MKCWLGVFSLTASQGTVPPESLQQFFSHTFTHVLTYNPQLKVSEAISLQREWSFARNSLLLSTLYQKLFVVLRAEELIGHLQQVLEANEVNWHHVLSCISMLLVCHAEAEQLVKDLLGHLLRKGFENYDLESLITAFLIARQAAFEGPALFMPYSEWFKLAFGSAGGFHGSSKKAVVFLFKFLSELVPFEAPQYLKVHIMHPPFVPAKYRPFLLEYITLAKTRLADFKVAIEDMGLYEDLSSTKDALQPHCQALQDAEKAVQIFENTGKIPAIVLEARSEKIPPNIYSKFIEECQSVKEKFLHGGRPGTKAGDLKGPLELLKAELEALKRLVTDQSRQDALPAQVAVISEKLAGVLGRRKDEDEAASLSLRIKLNLSVPEVQQQDQEPKGSSFGFVELSAGSSADPDILLLDSPVMGMNTSADQLQLQYVVPRLSVEARGTGCGGDVAGFPWKSLFHSAVCYQKAVLCLWKQTRFRKLLQEKMFQEMLLEVELERRRAPPDSRAAEKHFLFRVLQGRLKALGPDAAEGERLLRQQELILQRRILLGLPPSLLITTQWKGKEIALDCEDFFCFVNTELKNVCSRGYALSYDITAHFFRRWWRKLEPVLCCEWKRLFTVPLAQGLQRLGDLRRSVNSFLSSEASSLVSDLPWISAAFLHSALQQQTACEKAGALKRLGPGADQEGVDVPRALDWSSQVARLLEEEGSGWLVVFCSGETEHSLDPLLRGAASDQHRKQLPVAFYSLLFTLHPERLIREPMFLSVAVDMYTQLLQLFMEGPAVLRVDHTESLTHGQEPEDPLAVIQAARRFLVQAIPQCPLGSFSHLHQLLDLCGELDPELKAALTNSWQPTAEGSLSDDELLLF
ncbi:UNVERIFIED_CONTAM: hypothetical protein K2H54_046799 [Gekko kuhli]